jgi:HEPN domain-containing protein
VDLRASRAGYAEKLERAVARVVRIQGYYVPTRYPNGLPAGIRAHVFTRDAADGAVAMAREAVEWVGSLLDSGR